MSVLDKLTDEHIDLFRECFTVGGTAMSCLGQRAKAEGQGDVADECRVLASKCAEALAVLANAEGGRE